MCEDRASRRAGALRSWMRRTTVTAMGVLTAFVLAAAPASAGVPDQPLKDSDEQAFGRCGTAYLWFDDMVDFRKPQLWNSTSAEVGGYLGLQLDWRCGDQPKPDLPAVQIDQSFHFDGRSLSYSAGFPSGVNGSVDSKDEGDVTTTSSPTLTYNASDGYSARSDHHYSGVAAQGRNLSVVHTATATLTWPDGSTQTLSVRDEARD